MWSDRNRRSYLCVTAHWISRDKTTKGLSFKNALIAFHQVIGGHDGMSLAQTLLQLLDRAGIASQVSYIIYYSTLLGLIQKQH
jgi:hypothetical protein